MPNNPPVPQPPIGLLRLPQVKARTGVSRSGIYLGVKLGSFPAPIKLGARAVAWSSIEIDEWIAERIAERDAQAARECAP